ncbi:MAG: polyamine aminopropyltransferase [Christensenellales bacterium]|jgi:spermidine synthase
MDLWYTEQHTEDVRFSIRVNSHLFSGLSDFQRVDVFDSVEFGRFLTLDGLMMLTEKDEFIYHEMIVHVPMAVNPDIRRVLVIGGGDGGTVRELARYETIERIDMVEIDKMVVDVSREYLPVTSSQLDDKRVNLYFEDGLKFVRNCKSEYDLIVVDSTDAVGPGEGLFTKEFYGNCYKALTDNGILVNQHENPYYNDYKKAMKLTHKRISQFFNISALYQAHIPTYPSGHWLFGFASKGLDPVNDLKEARWNSLNFKTRYYNTALHKGCFCLPNYVLEELNCDNE